ncbi:hypothetical protein [Galbitalea soli]|uniref:Uncharacterized protein n=1 Tax=Galbitalea soli TaxID=1268042 RepID=A0A7C9TS26_9MICO|nr:hypothetical protein [Galbitalea soli]NEM91860.1 hypothetical protein [Galbitalea soli]NYJ29304.1 hypothetical protein [Galbitalea soli]
MREIILSVDYGQFWPLSDIMWEESEVPDWPALLSPELIARLKDWAKFFNAHANEETGLFGSEEKRKWFDLEGVSLLNELQRQAGNSYAFTLDLWF